MAYVDLNGIGNFRQILMLRDPRDALVSNYFSRTISHPPPHDPELVKKFQSDRVYTLSLTIDEFALYCGEKFLETHENYRTRLATWCKGPVLRYEDMILDFDRWIANLSACLGANIGSDVAAHLYELRGFGRLDGENLNKHIRKGLPGDYKKKRSPPTIATLNKRFGTILDWLNLDRT